MQTSFFCRLVAAGKPKSNNFMSQKKDGCAAFSKKLGPARNQIAKTFLEMPHLETHLSRYATARTPDNAQRGLRGVRSPTNIPIERPEAVPHTKSVRTWRPVDARNR